jgi:hypothetical protein
MKKESAVIAILLVLLIIAGMYIGMMKFQQRDLAIYQDGAAYGYQGAIVQIFQKASQCDQVPIYVQNQTINLVAIECLQQPKNNSK